MNSSRKYSILCLTVAWLGLSACGAQTAEESLDGQSHWLTACDTDATCGSASCMCGLCTAECETDADCWAQGGDMTSRCADGESVDCRAAPRVCVPEGNSRETSAEATDVGTQLDIPTTDVPECPELATRVSLPPVTVLFDGESYRGPVSVEAIDEVNGAQRVTLAFTELVGGQVSLHFNGEVPLSLGLRYAAEVESGDGGRYAFITLRDDEGVLRVAAHSGSDALYQAGRFSTPEAFGATLEVRMTCQTAGEGDCFENEVRADYEATFQGDDVATTDGQAYETLSIDGRPYTVHFLGSSVDGEPLCEFETGRELTFGVIAQ
jgi:hypothetical protein